MFLIAAQDGKVISSLSVFNGDDRNKLHIDPVRSGLHGLYDLSQVFLGNRLVLIGTDGTVRQQALHDGVHHFLPRSFFFSHAAVFSPAAVRPPS